MPSTHEITFPAATYDKLANEPLTMLNLGLFADAVTEDDHVLISDGDGHSRIGRVTGIAAVVEFIAPADPMQAGDSG